VNSAVARSECEPLRSPLCETATQRRSFHTLIDTARRDDSRLVSRTRVVRSIAKFADVRQHACDERDLALVFNHVLQDGAIESQIGDDRLQFCVFVAHLA